MSDEELIDFVYYEVAGKHLQEKITNWEDIEFWMSTVAELPKPARYAYLIGVFHMQVMNGGFQQYYDNLYGVFAPETLVALKEIGANRTYNLVSESLKILNKFRGQMDLVDFLKNGGHWNNKEIEIVFENLDDQYYESDNEEDLTKILGSFLRSENIYNRP